MRIVASMDPEPLRNPCAGKTEVDKIALHLANSAFLCAFPY